MNILVMAGTKDAVDIIKILSNKNKTTDDKNQKTGVSKKSLHLLATTTTPYGAELAQKAGAHETISKPLPSGELSNLIVNKNIDVLIDATHPFAAQATSNAIDACEKTSITYMRYERPYLEHDNGKGIHKVSSFEEAGQVAFKIVKDSEKNVLHLAGVSTINKILQNIPQNKLVVRVLPNIDSITKCLELEISAENIIAMQGVFSKEFNQAIMREFKAGAIITKESGETGGVPSKIKAALELGLEVVLVNRPEIKELSNEMVFNSLKELEKELNSLLSN